MPREGSEWKTGTCNCPKYLENYICKHVVGMAIRNNFIVPPLTASAVPIGKKRGKGRPKTVAPGSALLLD